VKISLITPAPKATRTGNRTTAVRWARLLRGLGHRVELATRYDDTPADVMIALHAWRSADNVRSDPDATLGSMRASDMPVGLHDLVSDAMPREMHGKLRVIYQSVPLLPRRLPPLRDAFEVLVVGHLREEKDPLRTAQASCLLPVESRIRSCISA
jgi:hypothetical protein